MSPSPAGKSRVSILETLSRVVPVVTRNIPGAPDPQGPRLVAFYGCMYYALYYAVMVPSMAGRQFSRH